MPRIDSIIAYEDCRTLLDRAIASPQGVRASVPSKSAATVLRARCNKFRQLDRKANREIYAGSTSPLAHASVYDSLVLTLEEEQDKWYVKVLKDRGIVEIEEL